MLTNPSAFQHRDHTFTTMSRLVLLSLLISAVSAFAPSKNSASAGAKSSLRMAGTPMFDPKNEAGVSGPFGFFDPFGKVLLTYHLTTYCNVSLFLIPTRRPLPYRQASFHEVARV